MVIRNEINRDIVSLIFQVHLFHNQETSVIFGIKGIILSVLESLYNLVLNYVEL